MAQIMKSLLFLVVLGCSTSCKAKRNHNCAPSSCGNIRNISYPFRLVGDPKICGDPKYELSCEDNRTVLYLSSKRFFVEDITYQNFSIRLVDPGVVKSNFSSFPIHSLHIEDIPYEDFRYRSEALTFINCPTPPKSDKYFDTNQSIMVTSLQYHSYAVVDVTASEVEDSCSISITTWISNSMSYYATSERLNINFSSIHDALAYGFELLWYRVYCRDCDAIGGFCPIPIEGVVTCDDYDCSIFTAKYVLQLFKKKRSLYHTWKCILKLDLHYGWQRRHGLIEIFLGSRFLIGILLLVVLVVYQLRRLHLSIYDDIEDFLQSHNNLVPIRYGYSEIKKMTNGFKQRLGEGGYGTVFKGKLRSGPSVAVKMLGKSKATGQEFINEVATIGRIHHVNVVQLVGFCVEGSKRALVYDFMPNGSLEMYIFPTEGNSVSPLSCEKMFEISLGVAHGIEYLHRGCDMQILHFDIKPHNILLDENFVPKVSDFGLAKLYPTDDSIVSLTAARGTMGYMAPELFYQNIGGVSYKADVYSFGMLLMEMASRRKNLNAFVDHSSQIYFPSWAYDQFDEGKDIDCNASTEEEKAILKKMILVALWCIQLKPSDRPSMSKVVEMLEGDVELLQMPPKPFLSPQEMPAEDDVGVEMNRAVAEQPLLAHSNFVKSFSEII